MGAAVYKNRELTGATKSRGRSAVHLEWTPAFDPPWRRFRFTAPASIAASALLIGAFSLVLRPRVVAPEHREAIAVRLIEPPPQPTGLQGDNKPQPIPPAPRTAKPRRHQVRSLMAPVMAPPVVSSGPSGIAVSSSVLHPEPPPADTGIAGQGGGGIGSDTIGARALYAPKPAIPDDLRENLLETEAVAHFMVGLDGEASVTLVKPTSSPRLNQVLLETLRQWKFFPAIKSGVAIASEFDIRIPITVN
jgi:periplasmic protein TonB